MSHDLYFWPAGAAKNPRRLADRLADEEAGRLVPDSRVLAFRAELLHRWPDLADMIAPWHTDLGRRQPWGRTDLADRFAVLTLPYGWEGTGALAALAGGYGLDCYDPQSEQLVPAGSLVRHTVFDEDVAQVEGQVAEEHVVQLLRHISGYIGYAYDDLDESALTGALDDKDGEVVNDWFEYPLSGTPALLIRLAKPADGAVVSVRVEGGMGAVLAARIGTLLDRL